MQEPKVLSVFGTRPEVVKMAPSVQAEEDDWVLLQGAQPPLWYRHGREWLQALPSAPDGLRCALQLARRTTLGPRSRCHPCNCFTRPELRPTTCPQPELYAQNTPT